tara:strand:- start:3167 stop:3814 length:648 start_codon:yes stop_codon:yes gene_type:complete
MKLLELFKGTGSIGKVFKQVHPEGEVYSVDILKKYDPTYCGDIMDFDYKQFKEGHFDIIWASPECKVFSVLQNTWLKTGKRGEKGKWDNMDHLNQVRKEHGQFSKKTKEIIEYLKPKYWFIENPWASAMKDLEHMKDLPCLRFDYCRFGYEYQKPTRIWTNRTDITKKICECKEKHKFRLGANSSTFRHTTTFQDTTNINQRYSIPPDLVKYLLT